MRIRFVIFVTLALGACQKDRDPKHDPVDAAVASDTAPPAPDASVCPGTLASCSGTCVNETNDHDHCGACTIACAPAASCVTSACACPATFIAATPQVLATQMLTPQPGFVTGAVGIVGSDANQHAVVVTAAAAAPLATALPVNGQVFVAVAYQLVTATQSRSTFLATAGTVRLTRRCAAGIAGTVQGATLVEVDPVTLSPISGGCSTTIAELAFDIAQPCP